MTEIVLIDNILDFNVISPELLQHKDTKIFSFNLEVHHELELQKIRHEIADDFLNQEERLQLFDKGLDFLSWYSKIPSNDLEFEGVNLLKILDTHEFHSYLMPNLIKLLTIKRIIEKENPTKIICTSNVSNIVQSITRGSNIKTKFFQNNIKQKLLWDTITIKYNLGPIPISFNLSKNNYLKIKKFLESSVGFFYNFWLDHDSTKKKSIILLEFNSESFSNLLHAMKNYDGNVILVNRRRSAVWSKTAISVVKKSNCKILNFDKILTENEMRKIPLLVIEYSKKMEKLWKNTDLLHDIFQIENCSFWNVIKDVIIRSYSEKLSDYILLVWSIKNLFENMDIRCIASLNEIGETEKAFLEFNNKKVPTILLEHGFVERDDKTKRFDKVESIKFKDKLAVWGDAKKKFLINEYDIDSDRIIVTGSPRHDAYFNSRTEKKFTKEKIVLLAPNPITEIIGFASTSLELKFENTIKEVFSVIEQFANVKVIVKLHPNQNKHNQLIKPIIQKIDSNIPVYLSTPIIELINNSDVVIVITPESLATPTILLESMILGKPTMNIILDDYIPKFTHIEDKAVLTVSNNSDLEEVLKKILFDETFQKELKENADNFVNKFLNYRGNASEKFANILKSF